MPRNKEKKDQEYEVEVIIKAKRVPPDEPPEAQVPSKNKKRGKGSSSKGAPRWKYFVKWDGYSSDQNTWEPEEHLASCDRLVRSFWDHVDPNNELLDSPVGTEVVPEPEWIVQEQIRFRSELSYSQPTDGDTDKGSDADVDDSDDQPLQASSRKHTQVKRRRVKKRPLFLVESDDDHTRPRKEARITATTKRKRRSQSPSVPSTDGVAKDKIPLPHRKQSLVLMPETPTTPMGPQGISVKQRLSQIAITPSKPKDLFLSRANPQTQKRILPKFQVRLKQLPGTPSPQLQSKESLATLPPPATPTPRPSSTQGLPPVLPTTPIHGNLSPRPPLSRSESPLFSADESTHDCEPAPAELTWTPDLMAAVNTFLASATGQLSNSQQAVEPLETGIRDTITVSPPIPSPTRAAPETASLPLPLVPNQSLPKNPKVWSWKGPLFLGSDKQPACNLYVHSVGELRSKGMRFSTALAGVGSMRFEHAYDKVDVESILNVFSVPSQVATVDCGGIGGSAYRELCIYLTSRKQVLLHPIVLDGTTIGFVAIFSSYLKCFQAVLGDIFSHLGPLSFAAVLLTFVLNPEQQRTLYQLPKPIAKLSGTKRSDILIEKVKYILAIHPTYISFLSTSKPYGLWPALPPFMPPLEIALETTLLEALLRHIGCPAKTLQEGVRAIFVHTSALKTLGSLPYLNDRRKVLGTHFFLYGPLITSPMRPVSRVVEIFPSGGVMTFDAQSILEDPVPVLDLIENVDKHFLWVSYILPETLGLVAHLACQGEDPLEVYRRGDFPFIWLLSAVEGGQISLISAPNDTLFDEDWLSLYGKLTPPSSQQALEMGVQAFERKFGKKGPAENIHDVLREQIHRDMAAMQQQRAIMLNYRRYVCIHGSAPVKVSAAHNWVEWTGHLAFDFLDEWFPKQT